MEAHTSSEPRRFLVMHLVMFVMHLVMSKDPFLR
jgi:hypothetical protein